jgi:hypothetical protein
VFPFTPTRPSTFALAAADKSDSLSHPTRRADAPSQRVGEGRGEGSPLDSRLSTLDYAFYRQFNITLPDLPLNITSKPFSNSSHGKRCVITGLMSSPLSIITVILYQVSYISRP